METLATHPAGKHFVMAGRLRGGSWNAGLFECDSGKLVHSLKVKYRITQAVFNEKGDRLFLAGGKSQPRNSDGKFPDFGRVEVCEVALEGAN